jgi:hypothetical protein
MLAASKLKAVMESMLTDGIDGVCLMTIEGSLLCSVSVHETNVTETGLAAISSTIWSNYEQASADVSFHLMKLEKGMLGIVPTGKTYLLAAYGEQVNTGLLKGKLEALSTYFTRSFDQVNK